jgi:hypothetical protein
MNSATIPALDPLPLPAPAGLLWSLLMLTFFLHLLPMNFVLGGSLIAALARLRGRDPARPHHRALAEWLAKAMPVAVAAAVSFGVAPLLFVQTLYGRLFFSSSVVMAWFWLGVIPLLILAYYGSYLLAFRGERLGGSATAVAGIVALFFVAIAFLYSNNMSLMLRPEFFTAKYAASGSGWQLNLGDPTLVPRFLHMLLGALAVAGMAVTHYGLFRLKRDPEFGDWAIRHGTLWFLIPTIFNLLAGAWWLAALPREVMLDFMGRDGAASAVLVLGALLGLTTLLLMAMWVYSPRPQLLARFAGTTLVLTLVAMIFTRDHVRQAMLRRAGFQANGWVAPQWGPIAIFALLLLMALAVIVWMVAIFVRARPDSSAGPAGPGHA